MELYKRIKIATSPGLESIKDDNEVEHDLNHDLLTWASKNKIKNYRITNVEHVALPKSDFKPGTYTVMIILNIAYTK